MQLQTYIRILLKRGWIMIALAIGAAIAAFAFSTIQEQRAPVYKSTVKVLVQPSRTDFGQAQAARQLLRSYVAWLDSTYRAADVIDLQQLDMTPEQLLADTTIASDDSRLVIQIDVESPNGDVGNDIARSWAQLFIQWRDQENQKVRREDRIDAQIIDDPRYSLDSPKTTINTLVGAILGFLVGLGIVFVLEYLEAGILHSPEDVARFLELPILGSIPPGGDA